MNGLNAIPDDAIYIVQTSKPIEHWNIFSQHAIWQNIKQIGSLSDLSDQANYLDTLIRENAQIFDLFGKRDLILSAHKTSATDYDFLFVIGLEKEAKKELVLPIIDKLYKSNGYQTSTETYENHKVLHANLGDGDVLSFSHINNQLICSFSKKILFASIQKTNAVLYEFQDGFATVYKEVYSDKNASLFIHYKYIGDWLTCYFPDGLPEVVSFCKPLQYSGFEILLEEENWQLKGLTTMDTSEHAILTSICRSGGAENSIGDVLSNRTAWYLRFGFNSFNEFQTNLTSVMKQDIKSYDNYQKQIHKMENLMGISVEENILSWVGDEVCVAQMNEVLGTNNKPTAVVALKTKDVELAQKELDHVASKIKKRTPAIFKEINYHNYLIRYMDVKGFFKIFFGDAFNKIERPYYTIIDEFVVFSNSPYSLVGLIDDYENGRNLSSVKDYTNLAESSKKSSLTLYANPQQIQLVLGPHLTVTGQRNLKVNKPVIDQLQNFWFNLESKDLNEFSTHLQLSQSSKSERTNTLKVSDLKEMYDRNAAQNGVSVEWIDDGLFYKYFPGTQVVQIKAETDDGVLDGSYEEFDEKGNTLVAGKYKDGRKKGVWKYYDASGNSIKKEKY